MKFVKAYILFFEAKQGLLFFLILEAQVHYYSSRIFSTISHVMFEKNHATFDTVLRMTTRITRQLAKMLSLQQKN